VTLDVNNLITMANKIGQFFESMPDREQAKADIATHIKRFWEPRMRKAMLAALDSAQADGMTPIVREAIASHRSLLG
jgi:formate dehydrogenase subunit delta